MNEFAKKYLSTKLDSNEISLYNKLSYDEVNVICYIQSFHHHEINLPISQLGMCISDMLNDSEEMVDM